ncbi:MAG TPA: SDR family oxidoreductase [Ohtaekwangia sp.]|nr:SDR family oxidoreductase [Ohtaekwangia sp.]
MSKKISILGCGWLGKPLAVSLLASGHSVKGSTTHKEKLEVLAQAGIEPYLIDLSTVIDAGDFLTCDYLIVSVPPKRKTGDEETFASHIARAVDLCRKGNVSTVIFLSATSVYYGRTGGVTEEHADPSSAFFRAERLFLDEPSFDTVVIRFAGLVGPLRHPGRFLSGKTITGADDPVNLIHQRDCIGIIEQIIKRNVQRGVYNACSNGHPAREKFYLRACGLIGLERPVFVEPRTTDARYVISDKLRQELEYTFVYDDPMSMDF